MRLIHPSEVKGDQIAWVAGVGILINSVSAYLFFKDRKKDLNVKGAYLHLLADALVSPGVVIAGLVIHYTEWFWLDPVVGLIIMIVILINTWSLLKDSFKMSIDAVPDGVDLSAIKNSATKNYGVKEIHHVHIWSLSTTENVLTVHIVPGEHLTTEERKQMVKQLKEEFLRHNIHHLLLN